jgi:hypothetical protein
LTGAVVFNRVAKYNQIFQKQNPLHTIESQWCPSNAQAKHEQVGSGEKQNKIKTINPYRYK